MKVLVFTHSYSGNGAAVMLLAAMDHWIRSCGWTVDVWMDVDMDVPEEVAELGCMVCSEPVLGDYDFVLVNTVMPLEILDVIAGHAPVVVWTHEGQTVLYGVRRPPERWRELFGSASRIVFQTPWQSDAVFGPFLDGIPRERIAHVANGLPALPANLRPRARKPGMRRIAFVGGVYPRKRPDDLIEAVAGMDEPVELVLIGTTEHLASLRAPARTLLERERERFILAGQLDRRSTLEHVLAADIFCLPSSDESQPIAPVEAATLGVPCVLSDLPPYAGIWQHGVNCLMQPVGDVERLRANLVALLHDDALRERVVAGGTELARRFSMPSFLERMTAAVTL